MSSAIDLHIHTTASDGSVAPSALPGLLRAAGVHTFAVTDHDAVDGAREVAGLPLEGLLYIPGVEFSCISAAGRCHLLGYGCDFDQADFAAALATGHRRREEKLEQRLALLNACYGVALTGEERDWLMSRKSPGKPHIAALLVNRGMADSVGEAIRLYLEPLHDGDTRIPTELAMAAVLKSGGVPVWAHPLGGEGERRLERDAFLRQLDALCAMGLMGLECRYSRYTSADSAFLRQHAERRGLAISGGSDFHGTNKKNIALGQLSADEAPVAEDELTLPEAVRRRGGVMIDYR